MKICIMYCSNKSQIQKKKLIKALVKVGLTTVPFIIAFGIPSPAIAAGVDAGVSTANNVGYEIWKIVKWAAMWIMAVLAAKDILQALNEGDHKQILQIMFKYGIAFACIAGMIKFFTWIDHLVTK